MKLVQSLCLINSSGLFTGLLQVSRGICFIFVGSIAYITELICYLCKYENRMRFGMVELETGIPFVSALTFRYLCIKCRAVSWYICGNFLYDRDCLCKKNRECEYVGFVEFVAWLS